MNNESEDRFTTTVITRNNQGLLSKSSIWVESSNFYGAEPRRRKRRHDEQDDAPAPYVIIGFDTEYKGLGRSLTRQELMAGDGRNEILSYQVWCKVVDPSQPDAREWGGICFAEDGSVVENRLGLQDLVTYAVWQGIGSGAVSVMPMKAYLVGHFTRADIPNFSDFADLTQ